MKSKAALAKAYKELRLEERPDRGNGVSWMTLDSTNSGSGVFGTEEVGRDNYEKTVMFRALELIDAEYDWHEHDWHTLSGTATERVAKMIEWRRADDAARAEAEGYHALVGLVMRGGKQK